MLYDWKNMDSIGFLPVLLSQPSVCVDSSFHVIRFLGLSEYRSQRIMSFIRKHLYFSGGHMSKRDEKFYLIRADILPESIAKTIEVKKLLESGEIDTVNEAVERVGLSRSAFYKYKDAIFPFNAMMSEKIMTVSLTLEHRSGILSKVLQFVAEKGGNVLTINQTIPLQGIANVAMSVDMAQLHMPTTEFLDLLEKLHGVRKAMIVGRG